jgi:hypothetical protein
LVTRQPQSYRRCLATLRARLRTTPIKAICARSPTGSRSRKKETARKAGSWNPQRRTTSPCPALEQRQTPGMALSFDNDLLASPASRAARAAARSCPSRHHAGRERPSDSTKMRCSKKTDQDAAPVVRVWKTRRDRTPNRAGATALTEQSIYRSSTRSRSDWSGFTASPSPIVITRR